MSDHFHAHMDRAIFKLGLEVEATSAYILVATLVEQSIRPSIDEIKLRWTTSEEDLEKALTILLEKRILTVSKGPDDLDIYTPNPASLWRWSKS